MAKKYLKETWRHVLHIALGAAPVIGKYWELGYVITFFKGDDIALLLVMYGT